MARNAASSEQGEAPDWAMGPGGEVETVDAGSEGMMVPGGPATQTLVQWLADKAQAGDMDTFAAMEAAIARMLQSESPDQVLAEDMPLHGREFLDTPFTCLSFSLREGEFEEGSPFYALLECKLGGNGERRVLSVGGWKVLAQLMMLDKLEAFPVVLVIRGKKTRQGFTVLSLQRPI